MREGATMKPLYKGSREGSNTKRDRHLVHELLVAALEQVAQLAELFDLVREHGHLLLDTGQLLHNTRPPEDTTGCDA